MYEFDSLFMMYIYIFIYFLFIYIYIYYFLFMYIYIYNYLHIYIYVYPPSLVKLQLYMGLEVQKFFVVRIIFKCPTDDGFS